MIEIKGVYIMKNILDFIRQSKKYNRTVKELRSLSDRELSDIGIIRCDIKSVARDTI
jgi:uncharacterized protein YjiS (DUF1127 family)